MTSKQQFVIFSREGCHIRRFTVKTIMCVFHVSMNKYIHEVSSVYFLNKPIKFGQKWSSLKFKYISHSSLICPFGKKNTFLR